MQPLQRVKTTGMSLSCAGWGCWAGCFTWTSGRREGSFKGFPVEETGIRENISLRGKRSKFGF